MTEIQSPDYIPAIGKWQVINCLKVQKQHGKTIASIASSYYYVYKDEKIENLTNEFQKNDKIFVVGVVDDDMQALGIIHRERLFSAISRAYGWDIYKNRCVTDVMQTTDSFHVERNIFSIADEIEQQVNSFQISYFLVKSDTGRFEGIFSTIDVLKFLSNITKKDIQQARKIQHGLMKESECISDNNSLIICGSCMAKTVGGDFYYVKKYNDTNWLIALCDVSGKGIAASLVASFVSGIFKQFNPQQGLLSFITKLNSVFIDSFQHEKFLTGVFIDYNSETGEADYCDMGHSHCYIVKQERMYSINSKNPNMPIGVDLENEPVINFCQLEPDDMMLLVTDGFIEQTNSMGKEYSLKRLSRIAGQLTRENPAATREAVFVDYHLFRGNQPQFDDATFALITFLPGSGKALSGSV